MREFERTVALFEEDMPLPPPDIGITETGGRR